jgi:hypothetical protein
VELGFETVGNATLIVHDNVPVLVTDPWLGGPAYFGSWGMSHPIPSEQAASIASAPWIWFSHGHPDHLNPDSLPSFREQQILLADHVGSRIASDLRRGGYSVTVLKDNVWFRLSDRVRVLCLADYNQDSVLLVDVGGRLVVNLNDSTEKGWGSLIRHIVRQFDISFAMRLTGYGDADMINFVDENGMRIRSGPEIRKDAGYAVGAQAARMTDALGCRYFVPFSSFHRYQRSDSVWANDATTSLRDIARGYSSAHSEILPAFVRYDCSSDIADEINPMAAPPSAYEPEEFGDSWSDELSQQERAVITRYFTSISHLHGYLGFINIRVGRRDLEIPLGGPDGRGITFHVPRNSLLKAVEWEIFDDLLIGNFMRTTLHGQWPETKLARDVTPYVAKYADNGRARTESELDAYFTEYRRRLGHVRYLRHAVERRAKETMLDHFARDSPAVSVISRAYQHVARHT